MSLISVNNLTFGYEGSYNNIFENVSFNIDSDWKLGLVGRNGKGKTTLLKLLQGKYEYTGIISKKVDVDYFPFEVTNKERNAIEIVNEIAPNAKEWEIIKEINNLSKRYGKRENFAIEGINIECKAGEIVGLVGKNGAGKSTTIKCLTGFLPFEDGEVKICGHDIRRSPIEAKKNLGYVPDNRATFEKMTGIEYINFIADIHGVSLPRRVARISEMQQIFKLNDKI